MEIEGFNAHSRQQWHTIKWQVYPWNLQYLRVCEIPLSCLLIGMLTSSSGYCHLSSGSCTGHSCCQMWEVQCSYGSNQKWVLVSVLLYKPQSRNHLTRHRHEHRTMSTQPKMSCSLLIPLLSSLFMLPMLTNCCLSLAYWSLTKPLPITYPSVTNSAYSLPFLYFNAVSSHVFKPLGSAQWKESPISRNYPSLSLSQSVSPQLFESCRLQWRPKGSDIQVLFNLFKSKYFSRLKQSLACLSFIFHCFWTSGAPFPLCCTNLLILQSQSTQSLLWHFLSYRKSPDTCPLWLLLLLYPRSILYLCLHHPLGVDPLPPSSAYPLWTLEVNHHLHIFIILCWCCVWVITLTQIHTLTHTAVYWMSEPTWHIMQPNDWISSSLGIQKCSISLDFPHRAPASRMACSYLWNSDREFSMLQIEDLVNVGDWAW